MSVATCSSVGRSLETANTGWIRAGTRFNAAANTAANMMSADTFARTMTRARNRERSENLCVATVKRQRVPHRDGNERHDRHRPRGVEKLNADHLHRRLARRGERSGQVSQRQQHGDEQTARDDGRTRLREDLGAVGIRRDQVVLDKTPQEQASQIAIRRQRSPHRRCPARSVQDPGASTRCAKTCSSELLASSVRSCFTESSATTRPS